MDSKTPLREIDFYLERGLSPFPLDRHSNESLVRWCDGVNPPVEGLRGRFGDSTVNIGVHRGENRAVTDRDCEDAFVNFIAIHDLPQIAQWSAQPLGKA